jgi:hypothetical protein
MGNTLAVIVKYIFAAFSVFDLLDLTGIPETF